MQKSESIGILVAALIAAQKELKIVEKSAENPFFKSKYADLPAIDKEYKRVFPSHGLVVTQFPDGKGLTTVLAHSSGEWISSTAEAPLAKADPQGLGSMITYLRRYALAAVCGIVTDYDDDDGHHASTPKPEPKQESKPAAEKPVSGRVIGKIQDRIDGGMGFVRYKIRAFELSTKKGELIDIMDKCEAAGNDVQVDYDEVVKGKFTNRYIARVEVMPPVPF